MPFEETEEGYLRVGRVKPPDDEKLGWRWWLGQVAIVAMAVAIAAWAGPPTWTSDWNRLSALEGRVSALEADR